MQTNTKRRTVGGLNKNIRAAKVYPVFGSKKRLKDLKTVGISLCTDSALHLAGLLLAAAAQTPGAMIDVTAFRKPRNDGTHQVTVTIQS